MHPFSRRQTFLSLLAFSLLPRPVRAGATHTVTVSGMAFAPADLTITAGDRVTFVNQDAAPHTATFDGGMDTGTLGQGESATLTFDRAGTHRYACRFHPSMRGTIRVQ